MMRLDCNPRYTHDLSLHTLISHKACSFNELSSFGIDSTLPKSLDYSSKSDYHTEIFISHYKQPEDSNTYLASFSVCSSILAPRRASTRENMP